MRKLSLLIVEGDPTIRQAVAGVLRGRFGESSVATARSLAEALTSNLSSIDLVLTEWRLPDANGQSVLEALKAGGAGAVIVVTDANSGAVAAEAVLCGAADYCVRHADYLVMLPLVIEKNLAVDKLRRERDLLHRQIQEQNESMSAVLRSLEQAAATDHLTGLYNRRHFSRVLEQMYDSAVRSNTDLTCIMFDMDNFKSLNDTYGHPTGDAAIVTAANNIRDNLRRMDAAARYGGDEFIVLLPRSDAVEAAGVARRVREAYLEAMRQRNLSSVQLGMSCGVASLVGDQARSSDALVGFADAALYRAKHLGRDRVYVSSGSGGRLAG